MAASHPTPEGVGFPGGVSVTVNKEDSGADNNLQMYESIQKNYLFPQR